MSRRPGAPEARPAQSGFFRQSDGDDRCSSESDGPLIRRLGLLARPRSTGLAAPLPRKLGRPMALWKASAGQGGSREATAEPGRAGCGPIVEVPRMFRSTLKAGLFWLTQTGLEAAVLAGCPHRGMEYSQRLWMSSRAGLPATLGDGANTPRYRCRCFRGDGTRSESPSGKSNGESCTTPPVPGREDCRPRPSPTQLAVLRRGR